MEHYTVSRNAEEFLLNLECDHTCGYVNKNQRGVIVGDATGDDRLPGTCLKNMEDGWSSDQGSLADHKWKACKSSPYLNPKFETQGIQKSQWLSDFWILECLMIMIMFFC